MRHTDGADIVAALRFWREAGFSIRDLADCLDVSASTAYRWAAGRYRPNAANFIALREEIDMRYATENAKHNLSVVGAQLASAYAALETDAERARDDAKAAEVAEQMEATRRRESEAMAERYADARAEVVRQRTAGRQEIAAAIAAAEQPRKSAYATCDPFAIFNNSAELTAVERTFA